MCWGCGPAGDPSVLSRGTAVRGGQEPGAQALYSPHAAGSENSTGHTRACTGSAWGAGKRGPPRGRLGAAAVLWSGHGGRPAGPVHLGGGRFGQQGPASLVSPLGAFARRSDVLDVPDRPAAPQMEVGAESGLCGVLGGKLCQAPGFAWGRSRGIASMVRWNPRGARSSLSPWGLGRMSQMRTGTEPHPGLKEPADAWSAPAAWSCKDLRDTWGAAQGPTPSTLASRAGEAEGTCSVCHHAAAPFVPASDFPVVS